ncbi:MAG: thiol-disulfide isomerase/thioredoxin [Bacteroidia bacterium]
MLLLGSCNLVGKQLPQFEFITLNGNRLTSKDLIGKVVVINVWATWCGTCIKELPDLNKIYDKYSSNQDVVFLAFSDEDEAVVNKALARFSFKYQQIVNAKKFTSKIQTRLVKTYPQNIVVNDKLEFLYEVSDGSKNIFEDLDHQIQLALTQIIE